MVVSSALRRLLACPTSRRSFSTCQAAVSELRTTSEMPKAREIGTQSLRTRVERASMPHGTNALALVEAGAKLTLGAEPAKMSVEVLETLSLEALLELKHGAAFGR